MTQTAPGTHDIAVETFIYAYPLVLSELTRRARTNVTSPTRDGRAPMNQFGHTAVAPAAPVDETAPPEADTARSTLWYDVSREPLAIRVPDSGGRYYALWMRDMWTHLFAIAGTRNTGTTTQIFLLVPPGWRGATPSGAIVIASPTMHGWIDVKVRVNGASDLPNVQRFQRALTGTPLSQWGSPYVMRGPSVNSAWDARTPVRDQVARLSAGEFLSLFSTLTRVNPPGPEDAAIVARMERIGVTSRAYLPPNGGSSQDYDMFERAWEEAQRRIAATSPDGELRNGWRRDAAATDADAADYLHRAAIARGGLSPVPIDDGISLTADADADGRSLSSDSRYVLRFEPRQLPPVRGFWSLTMYDDRHLFAANAMDRYAIGDCDEPWLNADGSLDLYIQQSPPAPQSSANWLPAPRRGPFSMTLRLYWPGRDVIEGRWRPPAVRRVS
jgi:hypothetical protein